MNFKQRKLLMNALNLAAVGLMIWQMVRWSQVIFWISVVFVAAAIVANRVLWRCPHCGEHLGIGAASEVCPHCGKRLEDSQ